MEKEKLTPREREKKRVEISRKTLENIALQSVLSANQILENQSSYGDLAVNGAKKLYNEAMNSKEAREVRDNLCEKAQEKGDQLSVYGKPSIGDYEVSTEILQQLKENKLRLPLKDLGDIVKSLAGNYKYDFEVPKGLENYVPLELEMKRQMGEINPEDALTEKEKQALSVYNFLSEVYNRVVSLGTCDYLADLNELGRKMMKMYKPKESKE
jgi:hypothetical protein